jgi:ribose transport system permease protein
MTARFGQLISILRSGAVWPAVIILYLLAGFVSPAMFEPRQMVDILQVSAFLGMVALGQTMALLVGGVDLSVAGVVTLVNILSTSLMDGRVSSIPLGVSVPVLISAVVGLGNGVLVVWAGITPLIATLGINAVLYGGALIYTGGAPHGAAAPGFTALGQGSLIGLPASAVCWLVVAAMTWVLTRRTAYGRRLYAVGANPIAARMMGVSVGLVIVSAYTLASLLAGFGGLLITAYIGQPSLGIGDQFLLTSVAAAVVGGTALTGGIGGILGTVGGTLLITELNSFTDIVHVSIGAQYVVQGGIIALGIVIYQLAGRARLANSGQIGGTAP